MFNEKNKIYAIIDQKTCNDKKINIIDFTHILLEGGVRIIQYRNKIDNLSKVRDQFEDIFKIIDNKTKIIINDYPEIAKEFNCYLHLGQEDSNFNYYVPFGRSTHNLDEVQMALKENPLPEYIGFGAMFKSETKPDVLDSIDFLPEIFKVWDKDIVLIGGITPNNIQLLPKSKNIYYAIISGFFNSGSSRSQILKNVKKLIQMFN